MSKLQHSENLQSPGKLIPSCGWALANIIDLVTECCNNNCESGNFIYGLDFSLYVQVVNCISENLIDCFGNVGILTRREHGYVEIGDSSSQDNSSVKDNELKPSYLDLLSSVYQQWHLRKLLASLEKSKQNQQTYSCSSNQDTEGIGNLRLIDIVYFYNFLLRIFSCLNPTGGSLPILNVLSFTPGLVVQLWETLEYSIFNDNDCVLLEYSSSNDTNIGVCDGRRQKLGIKEDRKSVV